MRVGVATMKAVAHQLIRGIGARSDGFMESLQARLDDGVATA
jgi:hypothetical protein